MGNWGTWPLSAELSLFRPARGLSSWKQQASFFLANRAWRATWSTGKTTSRQTCRNVNEHAQKPKIPAKFLGAFQKIGKKWKNQNDFNTSKRSLMFLMNYTVSNVQITTTSACWRHLLDSTSSSMTIRNDARSGTRCIWPWKRTGSVGGMVLPGTRNGDWQQIYVQ